MTTTTIAIISFCAGAGVFFLVGLWIGTTALQSERDDNERLREFIQKILPDVRLHAFIRAGGKAFIDRADGCPAQKDVGAVSGNARADVSFDSRKSWVCPQCKHLWSDQDKKSSNCTFCQTRLIEVSRDV